MQRAQCRGLLGAVLIWGATVMAAPLFAQDPGQPVQAPILTLDQERLYNGSRAAERVAAEIERRTQELAAENREIEARLVAEELDLTERRPTMEPEAFRVLADAFDAKVQGIRAAQDSKALELQRLREEASQNFLRRITPLLAQIVQERGALVVLDRRAVFLSADSIDITDEAIERINASLDALPGPGVAPIDTDPAPQPDDDSDAPAEN